MSLRLVRVRLDDERFSKVKELEERGISLSELVGKAIDQRHAAVQSRGDEDLEAVMRRIYEMYPEPPDTPPRDYDVHDRKQARAAILRKLNRERV
jgi:hypothetical protein